MKDLERYLEQALSELQQANSEQAIEEIRIGALGRKGYLTGFMKSLGQFEPEERRSFGAELNQTKQALMTAFTKRKSFLQEQELDKRLTEERQDASLPISFEESGRIHPVSHVQEIIIEIFGSLGFQIAEGPDIEDDFHNFTALNFPAEHPAREVHDTFFLQEQEENLQKETREEKNQRLLLRTHTSPVQIRVLETTPPPVRIIIPGRAYRCDSDQTHTPMFHQVEGLVIDQETHMGHLKGCLETFLSLFFSCEVKSRFRPHYFPFTEPSAEMDIAYRRAGNEIHFGEGENWMEILGCGMVHPNVIRNCGLDPDQYQGFAFGMGLDRLAMLKYGISDLRSFFTSDIRWLKHYGFSAFSRPGLTTGLR